jgi:cardiolipin synthase (CMP-forming)
VAVRRGRGAARIRQPLDLPTMTQASPGHDATRQETQGAQGASAAAGQDGGQPVQDRVWTIPNALSVLRLLGVPLFLWLILQPVFHGAHYDGWALLVLALSGATDYLDGKIARAFGQVSRIGQLLDPAADRLYILATLAGLAERNIIPWWLVGILVGRDILMGIPLLILKRHGFGPPPVHFLGKAATFNLLYAFPLLLLGQGGGWLHATAASIGWAFAIWGTALYWLAAGLYVVQVRQLIADSTTR